MSHLRVCLWILPPALAFLAIADPFAVARPVPGQAASASEIGMVKRVIAARREYQYSLEQLHAYYQSAADAERRKWAETELLQFHRLPQPAYIIDLDVAGPGLHPDQNVPAANDLWIARPRTIGPRDSGSEYSDNQIRGESLFQQLLTNIRRATNAVIRPNELADILRNPQAATIPAGR